MRPLTLAVWGFSGKESAGMLPNDKLVVLKREKKL